jgi:predicted transposase YdaD
LNSATDASLPKDEALKYLLVNVIETYFELSGEVAERYRRLVARKEYRAVQEVELTWADRLMEKGREKGREEGREAGREAGVVEGMRRTLLRQLTAKFGELSDKVTERVRSMSEVELESILDRVLNAATLDELDLGD